MDQQDAFKLIHRAGDTPEMVESFLGACPEFASSVTGLLLAVISNSSHLAQRVLDSGVDVNSADEKGTTPLHMAATLGRASMTERLLGWGARTDVRDRSGKTPLQCAETQLEWISRGAPLIRDPTLAVGNASDYRRVIQVLRDTETSVKAETPRQPPDVVAENSENARHPLAVDEHDPAQEARQTTSKLVALVTAAGKSERPMANDHRRFWFDRHLRRIADMHRDVQRAEQALQSGAGSSVKGCLMACVVGLVSLGVCMPLLMNAAELLSGVGSSLGVLAGFLGFTLSLLAACAVLRSVRQRTHSQRIRTLEELRRSLQLAVEQCAEELPDLVEETFWNKDRLLEQWRVESVLPLMAGTGHVDKPLETRTVVPPLQSSKNTPGASSERRSLSGTCDLCNGSCTGKVVKAKEMAGAARNGFVPRVARALLQDVGLSGDEWRAEAISGRASQSDWLVCDDCMKELNSYL